MALGVRGIARQFRSRTGDLRLRAVFLEGANGRLRARLEALARQEYSFDVSECIFGWTAAFEQTWSHVRIRIRLNPDAGITDATMATLRDRWRDGIVSTWSNRWGIGRSGEITCPLTFAVDWVGTAGAPHHNVRVRNGSFRSNMLSWDTADPGSTAAHEYGHMHGLVDEYSETAVCPGRSPVNTGTVMDNNSTNLPSRMMDRFATNTGSSVLSI